jgi:hypothetical protein
MHHEAQRQKEFACERILESACRRIPVMYKTRNQLHALRHLSFVPCRHIDSNHVVLSGLGQVAACQNDKKKQTRAALPNFRSPTFRSMFSSSWRWAQPVGFVSGMFGIGGG